MILKLEHVQIEIDPEDRNKIVPYNWYDTGNTIRAWINGKPRTLSHWLLNIEDENILVDHKDQNYYNNKRNNLRISNVSNNTHNQKAFGRVKFKGVCLKAGKYEASITKDGKRYHLGRWPAAIIAAREYDKKAIELYGEFADLNFSKKEMK